MRLDAWHLAMRTKELLLRSSPSLTPNTHPHMRKDSVIAIYTHEKVAATLGMTVVHSGALLQLGGGRSVYARALDINPRKSAA